MRPIDRAIDVSVLHWIDVHVINVAAKIIFITDQVFPKPPLPYATLAFAAPRGRNILGTRNRARKAGLDQAPATGKVGIVQIACMWSGKTTHATTANGCLRSTTRTA
ncbi:MAG: hypothetical protein KGJ46_11740 [Xanthomonadaceae bacterium]|nr:hypothetical protein [Xanthomonadaceae bacterium]